MINIKTKISLLPIILLAIGYWLLASSALAAPINSGATDHYAWNDVIGWIDFGGSGAVDVSDTQLTGYANALQAGKVALDCATSPNGNICATSSFKVANDGSGNLSGWGWNDNIGWISFCGNSSAGSGASGGCPASPTYQVKIDGSTGDFSGWAWNDVVGWISFNCNNTGIGDQCPLAGSDIGRYKVSTSWRAPSVVPPPAGGGPTGIGPGGSGGGGGSSFDAGTWLVSSVFDTQVRGGAALNTVMWLGTQPSGTVVGIQIASSNSASGPWTYFGPAAPGIPSGNTGSAYEVKQGAQFKLNPKDHNNKRYFRYKVYLYWTAGATPEVQDVIVNYSP